MRLHDVANLAQVINNRQEKVRIIMTSRRKDKKSKTGENETDTHKKKGHPL